MAIQKTSGGLLGFIEDLSTATNNVANTIKNVKDASGNTKTLTPVATPASSWPSWATPVAIGGGALLLVVVLVAAFRPRG